MNNKPSFHDVYSKLLSERLSYFNGKKPDLVVCTEVYQVIFNTLIDCTSTSTVPLTNEAMNFIAQSYYDAILINGNQELDPNVFSQRAKLENIDTKQLAFVAVLLKGTSFASEVINEIKKRS